MNIGIDLRPLLSLHRTGVGEYTFELLNAIFTVDKTNDYFLFYNSAKNVSHLIPHWGQPNVHFIKTRWPNKLFNISIALFNRPYIDRLVNLKSKIKNLKLDYFYSPNFGYTALSSTSKHIITVHDISYLLFPNFYKLRQRLWHRLVHPKKTCLNTHHIITPSENTKQDLVRHYKINPNKISVIYPGLSSSFTHFLGLTPDIRAVASQTIKQKYNLPDNFVLYLGTIEPRKNIISTIRAFEKLTISNKQLTTGCLVIAGAPGWKNKEIFQAINNSPVKDKIKYIGFVEADDKPALYSLAKLFIYPSFYEGFGFPVLEATAMGVPVITSNRSSLPEITGSSAYLVHPHRPEEITEGMKLLLSDEILRQAQIKNGHVQVQKFHWESAAQAWLKLL